MTIYIKNCTEAAGTHTARHYNFGWQMSFAIGGSRIINWMFLVAEKTVVVLSTCWSMSCFIGGVSYCLESIWQPILEIYFKCSQLNLISECSGFDTQLRWLGNIQVHRQRIYYWGNRIIFFTSQTQTSKTLKVLCSRDGSGFHVYNGFVTDWGVSHLSETDDSKNKK
mgnify:CR=1 FL=1